MISVKPINVDVILLYQSIARVQVVETVVRVFVDGAFAVILNACVDYERV